MSSEREMLKSMRIPNARTNGEIMANAAIDAALAEPWWRLAKAVLTVAAVVTLCVIAYKL